MELISWTRERPLDGADAATWDQYVLESHPGGTLFHASSWQKVLDATYGLPHHHLAVREGGRLQGVLSLYRCRGLAGGSDLFSLPYTVYGGMLASSQGAAGLLKEGALEIAKAEKAGMVHLRNTEENGLDLPSTDLHVHFCREMGKTAEECLDQIPRKSRATIRNSIQKFRLESVVNRDVDLLWKLHAVNLRRLGTPVFPRSYFRQIMERLGDSADILFVLQAGKPVCGVMTFYYRDVCNPYFSGSLPEANASGANNFMYYALMCHALKRGCRRFDFGKSRRDTGPYRFKVNMGFEPRRLPYQFLYNTRMKAPNLNPSNPKLALFIRLWSLQPLWSSKLFGPALNRYLP